MTSTPPPGLCGIANMPSLSRRRDHNQTGPEQSAESPAEPITHDKIPDLLRRTSSNKVDCAVESTRAKGVSQDRIDRVTSTVQTSDEDQLLLLFNISTTKPASLLSEDVANGAENLTKARLTFLSSRAVVLPAYKEFIALSTIAIIFGADTGTFTFAELMSKIEGFLDEIEDDIAANDALKAKIGVVNVVGEIEGLLAKLLLDDNREGVSEEQLRLCVMMRRVGRDILEV